MADDIDTLIDNETENGSETVVVRIPISVYQKTYLPINNDENFLSCVFRKINVEDNLLLEKLSFVEKIENRIDMSFCDFHLYRKLLLRKCLLKFGEKEPKRDHGWIAKDDWHDLVKTNAMILNRALSEFEILSMVSEEEEKKIERQASVLFGSDNNRVMNPLPSLSTYCVLASVWDKFGLSLDTLKKMNNDDYIRIRTILSKEIESIKKEAKK